MKKWLALFIMIGLISACASRWREGELSNMSVPDVQLYVSSVLNNEGTGDARMLSQAKLINDDPYSYRYYTEAPSDLGPIYAVTPFYSFSFLSQEVFTSQVQFVKVAYIDKVMEDGGHEAAVIFDITKTDGTRVVEVFVNDASSGLPRGYVSEGLFEITLKGSNGQTITLFSDDTTVDDELADVIQFNVVTFEGGQDVLMGKLSTMIGYY